MSRPQRTPLAVLTDLRDREKQRLQRDVAEQRSLAERHRATLARLEALGTGAGASGAQTGANLSALSLNCGIDDGVSETAKPTVGAADESASL